MKRQKYNKLVRDLIPQIIQKEGKKAVVEALSGDCYIEKLEEKLNEELSEYIESKEIEELADLLEVIYALANAKGCSISELEAIRKAKAEERGGFDKRILLKEVIEN